MTDPFDLQRFVVAQQRHATTTALAELQAGRKRSHWMWFVFPQIAGLGSSPMAQRYAIASLDEARAYLAHPVLGPRLLACTSEAVLQPCHPIAPRNSDLRRRRTIMKFRSSLTLFSRRGSEMSRLFAHRRWSTFLWQRCRMQADAPNFGSGSVIRILIQSA